MITDNEKNFIGRTKRALDVCANENRQYRHVFPAQPLESVQRILSLIESRGAKEKQELFDQLVKAAKPINLNVIAKKDTSEVATAIAGLVREKEPEWGHTKQVSAWKHPLIDRLKLSKVLALQDIAVHKTAFRNTEKESDGRKRIRKETIDSFVGITSADYCVADSATLVMKTRPGLARAASLVPTIHVAVIKINQIIADLKELYTLLKHHPDPSKRGITNCLTFISGPSKTADIEAVMVHGAHGPRELHLFVITGDEP
jgi:L-lactate dehydrogenase complex protein LldG